jgi:putative ABC transport system permease protein
VVWIPLHGLQMMSGHDPRAATDVSAVLVQLRSPSAGFMLDLMYNKQGNRLTFAYPIGAIMSELFQKIGWFDKVLALVAYLVALVSAAGVLVAIYNSRALGAGRLFLSGAIVLEATVIGAIGMIAAFGAYAAIVSAVAAVIRAQTGVMIEAFAFNPVMLWAPAAMIALCAASGLLPAWKAYRTDVAGNLAPLS